MSGTLYPWQTSAWQQLQPWRQRLPHAILFHGPEGTGKAAFAERFAQALLCEAPAQDGQPCDQCASCNWFAQYNHPDYRRLRPEALDEDGAADGEPVDDAADGKKSGKAAKTPSKEIKIDQVRALGDFMNVSTHRQGLRVILLYPAETLNTAAANALLKTLEEPPPNTVFLLVSHSLDRLLPTILSRCRKFALPMPLQEQALAWLRQQGIDDADVWLAGQGGAPLAAQAMAQAELRETMDEFLRVLARPATEAALKAAEKLQKTPVSDLVAWQQRWLYDLFSFKLAGSIRYYPRYRKELAALAQQARTADLLRALKAARDRPAIPEPPFSARPFTGDMLLEYASIFPA